MTLFSRSFPKKKKKFPLEAFHFFFNKSLEDEIFLSFSSGISFFFLFFFSLQPPPLYGLRMVVLFWPSPPLDVRMVFSISASSSFKCEDGCCVSIQILIYDGYDVGLLCFSALQLLNLESTYLIFVKLKGVDQSLQ